MRTRLVLRHVLLSSIVLMTALPAGDSSCWVTPKFASMKDQSILKFLHCGF
jgi:hypothetical protein